MIDVVIVTFNSSGVIARCLESFEAALPADAGITVVDNASSDQTQDVVSRVRRVRLLVNSANAGFGCGCNVGIRASRADWVIVSNPDVVIEAFDMSAFLTDVLDPELGLLAFDMKQGSEAEHHASMLRRYPRWWSGVVKNSWGLIWPRRLRIGVPSLGREPVSRGLWASGAVFALRRDAWEAVGGFDERFFLYFEDVDLSRRLQSAGFRIRSSAALRGAHAHGQSSGRRDPRIATAWQMASWLQYVRTWEGPGRARLAASLLLVSLQLVGLTLRLSLMFMPQSVKLRAKIQEVSYLKTTMDAGFDVDTMMTRSPAGAVARATRSQGR